MKKSENSRKYRFLHVSYGTVPNFPRSPGLVYLNLRFRGDGPGKKVFAYPKHCLPKREGDRGRGEGGVTRRIRAPGSGCLGSPPGGGGGSLALPKDHRYFSPQN